MPPAGQGPLRSVVPMQYQRKSGKINPYFYAIPTFHIVYSNYSVSLDFDNALT